MVVIGQNGQQNGQQNGVKNMGHYPYFCGTTHMNMFDFHKSNSEKNWALFFKFISLISESLQYKVFFSPHK